MIIEINNKKLEFVNGLYFLGKALEKHDTDIQGLLNKLQKNPLVSFVDLMFFSLSCNAELEGIDLPITKKELIKFLESTNDYNNKEGILSKFSKELTTSIQGHFLTPKEDDATNDATEKKN